MFIWDFTADLVLGQIMDWIYGQIIGFLGEFFAMMGNMGAELFEMSWVQAIVLFFSYLAWALYLTGLVVSVFECGIKAQSGKASIKDTALNAIKGFMVVNLFSLVPVELYKLAITLQGSFTSGITGLVAADSGISTMSIAVLTHIGGIGLNPIMGIFCVILMGYAVIKVSFANLKRGGILLIQIAVGSMYMFSVPRGYIDGFVSWCKQVVGLCLTAFLQATILIAGLMVFNSNMLLGLGLMLAASEIPRISSTIFVLNSAVNCLRTILCEPSFPTVSCLLLYPVHLELQKFCLDSWVHYSEINDILTSISNKIKYKDFEKIYAIVMEKILLNLNNSAFSAVVNKKSAKKKNDKRKTKDKKQSELEDEEEDIDTNTDMLSSFYVSDIDMVRRKFK